VEEFLKELQTLKDLDYKKARQYLHIVTKCSSGNAVSPLKDIYILNAEKQNHPEECHDPDTSCGSPFITLQHLSVHYRDARKVYR
jgi:hypothetical protein